MFPRKARRKKKSHDSWKDSILIGPLLDKKKDKSVPLGLNILETDLNMFHEKMCLMKFGSIYLNIFS